MKLLILHKTGGIPYAARVIFARSPDLGNARSMAPLATSYREFWPIYLREHARPLTRKLHLIGTGLGLVLLAAGLGLADWRLIAAAVIAGYGFAWASHFLVEHNKPATFTHPFWSLIADFHLFFLWLTGRLTAELRRYGVS